MLTVKEISKNLKITPSAVCIRLGKEGIKGKKRVTTFYYTKEQCKKISSKRYVNRKLPHMSLSKTYNNQVKIIELYLQLDYKNVSEISRILKLTYWECYRVIQLFKKRECLIIQSKL